MPSKIIIRPATEYDSEQIANLWMKAWQISLKDFVPTEFLNQFNHQTQMEKYSSRIKDPDWHLLIAENDNIILGMIGAKKDELKRAYTKEIKAMYIDPDYQHQGIGTSLFNQIITDIKQEGTKNTFLWCIKANKIACSFYEKLGGKNTPVKHIPKDYSVVPHVMYTWEL